MSFDRRSRILSAKAWAVSPEAASEWTDAVEKSTGHAAESASPMARFVADKGKW